MHIYTRLASEDRMYQGDAWFFECECKQSDVCKFLMCCAAPEMSLVVECVKGMVLSAVDLHYPGAGLSSVVLVRQTRNGAVNADRHAGNQEVM